MFPRWSTSPTWTARSGSTTPRRARGPRAWLYRAKGIVSAAWSRTWPVGRGRWRSSASRRRTCTASSAPTRRSTRSSTGWTWTASGRKHGADERGCVFVGALDYRPNVEGAVWFCREVWPRLRDRVPGARLDLVGRRPAPAVRRLAEVPGVEVVGPVPDVRPYLARAAVAVVPLRIARGVQNKVLEALAMGKAVVASPQALTGLGVGPGEHVLSASSPWEWVEAIGQLLDDAGFRQRLGSEGRLYVEENHDWGRCLDPFGSLVGLPVELVSDRVGNVSASVTVRRQMITATLEGRCFDSF